MPSEFSQNPVVPIRQETVAHAVENAEDIPGRGCQRNCDQIKSSGFPEYPAKNIKKRKTGMEDNKETIDDMQQDIVHIRFVY